MGTVRLRQLLFTCAMIATLLATVLVLGSYIRPVHNQDYLEQAREGVPWVRWGLCSSLMGLLLSFFGKRAWRIVVAFFAALLFVWWFLIGMSLF
jgi:hypothetical protein